MKSLYETILASTQSGKAAFVKKWIFDNLFNHELHTYKMSEVDELFDITPDGISTKQKSNMGVDIDHNVKGEIPREIKFNQIYAGFTFGRNKNITVKQLPKYAHKLYINGEIGTIPSFKMELSCALEIEGSSTILSKIEPIELKFVECKKTGRIWEDRYIKLDNTHITKKDMDNIKCTGESITGLSIRNTDMQSEILKNIRLIKKGKRKGEYENEISAYLTEYFKNFPECNKVWIAQGELQRIGMTTYDLWLLPKGV